MSASAKPEKKPAKPKKRRGRLLPPLWLVLVTVLLADLIPAVRSGPIAGQHAVGNILTLVLGFTIFAVYAVWFCAFSGYPSGLIHFFEGALVGLAILGVALLRIDDVSGDLIPTLAWRWSPPRDAQLAELVPTAARLGEETENGGETSEPTGLALATPYDFPRFLGPRGDASIPGLQIVSSWKPESPEPVWRREIGAGWSSFAIVNGLAVTLEQRGPKELVSCYRVEDGKPVWSHAIEARHETTLGGIGPRSTPTIYNGRVYALGATGVLRCLAGDTGAPVWQVDVMKECGVTPEEDLYEVAWGRSASPLVLTQVSTGEGEVAQDLVIVPGGGPTGGPYVSLLALEAETGKVVGRWGKEQISYATSIETKLHGIRQVVTVNQADVSAYDPQTGERLWTYEWPGQSNTSANTSQAVPVEGNRMFISKGYGGGSALFAVNRSEEGRWSTEELWNEPGLLNTKFTNVVIHEGYVYGLDDGIFECARLEDGKRMWKRGRYGHGQVLRLDELLLVLTEAGEVVAVRTNPERHEEAWSFPAIEGKTWNNPAFFAAKVEGKLQAWLLVRNAQEAACYRFLVEPKP